MRKLLFFGVVLILFLVPLLARADVLMSEIAWMGTTASANAEWIEIYNNSPNSVVLDGWSLVATDGSPSIQLSGVIAGSAYALLERTSDESVPGIAATVIYTGSMSNVGEHFQLKDNLGNLADEVDGTNGWEGGDNITKHTMQRNGTSWITAVATPGAVTPKSSSSSDESPAETIPIAKPKEDESSSEDKFSVKPDILFSARMVAPDVGTAGVAVPITVLVKQDGKRDMVTGKFEWSMGDGAWYRYDHNQPVSHIYYYPGTYTITLNYYSNLLKEEPDSIHKKVMTIVPALIQLENKTEDGGIVLNNGATKDIALDGWSVEYLDKKFIFPKFTSIVKGQSLSISSKTLGFTVGEETILKNPSGVIVAKYSEYKISKSEDELVSDEVQELAGEVLVPISQREGVTAAQVPEVKDVGGVWSRNKWYVIAGIIGVLAILAYFAMRLYADRDEMI